MPLPTAAQIDSVFPTTGTAVIPRGDVATLLKNMLPGIGDQSWGMNAPQGALNRSLVMTTGAPTLTLSAAGAATALSGSPVTIANSDTRFESSPRDSRTGGGIYWPNGAGMISGHCNYWRWATDSADFEVVLNCVANASINIKVGDQYASGTSFVTSASGVYRVRVTHTEKLMRDIAVTGSVGSGFSAFNGVTLAPTDMLAAPAILSNEVWAVVTDSMGVGGPLYGGPSDKGAGSHADACMTALGIRRYVVDSVGGSGYIAGAANNFTTRVPLRSAAVTPRPTRFLIVGGYNDATGNTQAAIQTAALQLYDSIQALIPGVKIIAATTLNPQATDNATPAIIAAAAARSSFVSVIPGHTYIAGTGRVGTTTGVGNRDFVINPDGVHPAPYGYSYLGLRMAQDIMALRAAA